VGQYKWGYFKLDAAPLPGGWVGGKLPHPKLRRWGWYPAIEFTGAPVSEDDAEESKDGFLKDEDGNRYLYEVKRQRNGFGMGVPQLFEFYPIKKFALYVAAMPTFLHHATETKVEMVYENDRRIVLADPELDAKFQDIQTYETRNDESTNRWLMPFSLGMRWQLGPVHMRIAYTTRRMDSIKNYENSFQDVALFTIGYAAKQPSYYTPPAQPAPGQTPAGKSKAPPNSSTDD
jgi:hypothetical protein